MDINRIKFNLSSINIIDSLKIINNKIIIKFNLDNLINFSNKEKIIKIIIDKIYDEIINHFDPSREYIIKIDNEFYSIDYSPRQNVDNKSIYIEIETDFEKCMNSINKKNTSISKYKSWKKIDLISELEKRQITFKKSLTTSELVDLLDIDDLKHENEEINISTEIEDKYKKQIDELQKKNDEQANKINEQKQTIQELNNKKPEVIVQEKIIEKIVYKEGDSAGKEKISIIDDPIEKLKTMDSIVESTDEKGDLSVKLAEYGKNNTQIFTRETDINKMIESIGRENILNSETTILEPTSGDGAFTVRIIQYRLEKIIENTKTIEDFILESLKAISTIYSIEYEPDSCFVQRCNLYTMMKIQYKKFLEKNNLEIIYDSKWDSFCRNIIFNNVMWGAFAATNHPEYKNYENILGFDRASNRPLCVIKWNIFYNRGKKLDYTKELII